MFANKPASTLAEEFCCFDLGNCVSISNQIILGLIAVLPVDSPSILL